MAAKEDYEEGMQKSVTKNWKQIANYKEDQRQRLSMWLNVERKDHIYVTNGNWYRTFERYGVTVCKLRLVIKIKPLEAGHAIRQ